VSASAAIPRRSAAPHDSEHEIVAVYLGETALDDNYGRLGAVTIVADGHAGTPALNDGKRQAASTTSLWLGGITRAPRHLFTSPTQTGYQL
jgi:hypothetical protein